MSSTGISTVSLLALNTFRELNRSKALLTTIGAAVALVGVAALFGLVTIGEQIVLIKDFGLFSISLGSALLTTLAGTQLLHKELSRKTVYNILSKPISRASFVLGKFFGIVLTSWCAIAVITVALMGVTWSIEGKIDLLLALGASYAMMEQLLVCAVAIFFSSIVVTPVLSGFFTFAIFIAGRSADYLLYFVEKGDLPPSTALIFKGLYWGLPNLTQLNIADGIPYGVGVSSGHVIYALVYTISYSAMLLLIACFAFSRREFN